MYDDHFGLSGRPFQLTPDPRFWFETATHRKAMAYLGYGLAQGEGFIVITGDIGAGKTTLVGHLLESIDHRSLNAVKIVSTAIEPADLLRIMARALGVDPQGLEKAELLLAIERGLHAVARTGKRTLLVVDEAQALPVASLEELRMLSNFQAGGHAMLQIVLLGQPEFRDRLHGEERLEQLRQRVIAIHHLDPMEPGEIADYLAHRLAVVGWKGRPDFTAAAFDAFYRGSAGVPRRLNLLAGRVMLFAAVENLDLIDGAIVEAVIGDLHADLPMMGAPVAPTSAGLAIGATVGPTPEPGAGEPERFVEPVPARSVEPVAVVEPAQSERGWSETARAANDEPAPIAAAVPETTQPLPIAAPRHDPIAARAEPITPVEIAGPFDRIAEPGPVEAPAPRDPALVERIAVLEAQVEAQEAALRRVLTLLVDWVESDAARPNFAPIRNAAA